MVACCNSAHFHFLMHFLTLEIAFNQCYMNETKLITFIATLFKAEHLCSISFSVISSYHGEKSVLKKLTICFKSAHHVSILRACSLQICAYFEMKLGLLVLLVLDYTFRPAFISKVMVMPWATYKALDISKIGFHCTQDF